MSWKKVWNWLKDNWYLVLLFPVGLVVLLRSLSGKDPIPVLDPAARDDERARKQDEQLDAEFEAEQDRLDARVQAMKDSTKKQIEAERRAVEESQRHIRKDPKKVEEYLNRVDYKNVDNH